MKTSATSPLSRSIKHLCAASAAVVLLFGSATTAKADTVFFNQDYNSYSNGTLLTDVPGWYEGGVTPVINGGKIVTLGGNYNDSYIDLGGDIFSHGSDHVKISWDSYLPLTAEYNILFASGTAASKEVAFNSQVMGFQRGWYDRHYFYGWVPNTYFDYGDVRVIEGADLPAQETHFVIDAVKSGTMVTWGAFFQPTNPSGVYATDGAPLWTGGSGNARTSAITDPRGINTLNHFSNDAGFTFDNIQATAIIGVPEPTSALLMVAGGVSLLARRRREAVK